MVVVTFTEMELLVCFYSRHFHQGNRREEKAPGKLFGNPEALVLAIP